MSNSNNKHRNEEGNSDNANNSSRVVTSKPGENKIYAGNFFCIVCHEKIDKRYEIEIKDVQMNNSMKSNICRDCFNSFLNKNHKEHSFRLSKLLHKRDTRFRSFRF